MVHGAAAVAALQAAGDDVEALTEAIQAASWIDAVPGEDRQKLRGEMALSMFDGAPPALALSTATSVVNTVCVQNCCTRRGKAYALLWTCAASS